MEHTTSKMLSPLLILMFSFSMTYGQTFRAAFDRFDNAFNNGEGLSKSNNFAGDLVWGESYILMAYMAMYRSTNDPFYLRKVITHAKNVMQQRDDVQGYTDYRGVSDATWICKTFTLNKEPYSWIVDSGNTTYGMADCAQLIINTPELHNLTSNEGNTLIEDANWLVGEIAKTIAAHDDQWDEELGAYRFRDAEPLLGDISGRILPHNMYSAMGRTLLMMYRATQNEEYLAKVTSLANLFRADLDLEESNETYTWQYTLASNNDNVEDLSHAAIELSFAHLCFQDGILFKDFDFQRFANTIMENMAVSPTEFTYRVNGTDGVGDVAHSLQLGRILQLSLFEKDFYNVTSSLFMDLALYNTALNSPSQMFGVANCHLYSNLLNPVSLFENDFDEATFVQAGIGNIQDGEEIEVITIRDFEGLLRFFVHGFDENFLSQLGWTDFTERAPGSSDAVSLAVGNFDNDEFHEFVAAIGGENGDLEVHEVDNEGSFTKIGSTSTLVGNMDWIGVATGDLDRDNLDEIIGLNASDNQIYIYEVADGELAPVARSSANPGGANWSGVVAGDFTRNGSDELLVIDANSNEFYLYELNASSLSLIASSDLALEGVVWKHPRAGDFDNDGQAELVVMNETDGDLYFFNYDAFKFELAGKEFFSKEFFDVAAVGSGKLVAPEGDADDLVLVRNHDQMLFMHSVNLEAESVSTTSATARNQALSPTFFEGVAPNPSTDVLNIDFTDLAVNSAKGLSVRVFDTYGKLRLEIKDLDNEAQILNQGIKVNHLEAGLYYLKIGADNHFQIAKFVKQ